MRATAPKYAQGAATALSTSDSIIALGVNTSDTLHSGDVPQSGWLHKLVVKLTSIATAVSATWYLASDEDGDFPITPEVTTTITVGSTTSTSGSVVALINCGYAIRADDYDSAAKAVYLVIALDAGTATGTPSLEHRP